MAKYSNVTLGEILLMLDISNINVENLLKVTFYDLIIKNCIEIKRLKLVHKNEKAYFVFLNSNSNLKYHEKVLTSYLNTQNPISLKQLIYNLSNYLNPNYRGLVKKYRFESTILKSLQSSDFIKEYGIFRKKYTPSNKGSELLNIISSSGIEKKGLNNDFGVSFDNLCFLCEEFGRFFNLKKEEFQLLDNDYNTYMEKGKTRDFMSFPNIGDSYPEPEL